MRQFDHVMSIHKSLEPAAQRFRLLGFHVTDISHHPMGTGNRLLVFKTSFFEILAVTRPGILDEAFGALTANYLAQRSGVSGIAFYCDDPQDDLRRFEADSAVTASVGAFKRPMTFPDGSEGVADVDLVMSRNQETPLVFLFSSRQNRPEAVWQPVWGTHPNGAQDVAEIVAVAKAGDTRLASYFDGFLGAGETQQVAGGSGGATRAYPLKHGARLSIMEPAALEERYRWAGLNAEPHEHYVAGLVIRCEGLDVVRACVRKHDIPATEANGEILIDPSWAEGVFLHFVDAANA